MRKRIYTVLAIFCLHAAFAAPGLALDIGSCKVLAIDMNNGWDNEALNYLGIPFTFVSAEQFAQTDLLSYDVLFVSSAFRDGGVTMPSQAGLDTLNAGAGRISDFVARGGGVVALSEPIGTGKWAWTPASLVTFGYYAWGRDDVTLVDATHPVTQGLSSALLSSWGSSWHNYFISYPSTFDVLAKTSDGHALTLAGMFGGGKLFLTGQDPDFHRWTYGARTLLGNAIAWACEKAVLIVTIDIKPGSDPNCFNPNGHGVVPAAILGGPAFSVDDVDVSTLSLEGMTAKAAAKGGGPLAHYEDVNGDGYVDLVVQFDESGFSLDEGAVSATLTGKLSSGLPISGSDSICIRPGR